jgi:hypothetical protein
MAFADALKIVWIIMRALAGVALITSCFVERYTNWAHNSKSLMHHFGFQLLDLKSS